MRLLRGSAVMVAAAALVAAGAGVSGASGAPSGPPSITQLSLGRPLIGANGGASAIRLQVSRGSTCWFTAPANVQVDRSHRGCAGGRDWTVVRLGRATSTATATFQLTGWVRSANGMTVQRSVELAQAGLTPIVPSVAATLTVGVPVAEQLGGAGGHAPYSARVVGGSLPPGLSMAASGALSGTPTSVGTFSATVAVADSSQPQGVTADVVLVFVVAAPPVTVTSTSLPAAAQGTAYSATLTASGGNAPYTWAVTGGALPSGLTLAPTGLLSGTPLTSGTFTVTVQATTAGAPAVTATRQLTLTVAAATLQVTSSQFANASTGSAFSYTLSATGGTYPYTWSVTSGTLPPGLTLLPAGTITGTPTTLGTYPVVLSVHDSSAPQQTTTSNLTIYVTNGTLSITTPATLSPAATQGSLYTFPLSATGGTAPYFWQISSGTPPPGMGLQNNGLLTGTPTATGTYNFTVEVYDSASPVHTATEAITLTVN